MCTIAVEHPEYTVSKIREELLRAHPDLTLCESTVWRALNSSNLQMLRAKMRDPRSEGTPAHKAEKEAFIQEQQKGASGMLGAHNTFFMDETNVPLNLTLQRGWGTSKRPAEILHAKGKTQTIGLYAGIGLVSDSHNDTSYRRDQIKMPDQITEPRSNEYEYTNKEWRPRSSPPKFMLFYWLRPPRRENTVLDRFLDETDVRALSWSWNSITEPLEVPPSKMQKLNENDAKNFVDYITKYLESQKDKDDVEVCQNILFRNNVEYRQVDDDGNLVQVDTVNKKPLYIHATLAQMRTHLYALCYLVAKAYNLKTTVTELSGYADVKIPRYYFTKNGRQQKGERWRANAAIGRSSWTF